MTVPGSHDPRLPDRRDIEVAAFRQCWEGPLPLDEEARSRRVFLYFQLHDGRIDAICRRLGVAADAQDVLQEVALRLLNPLTRQPDVRTGPELEAWLWRVIWNQALSVRRRARCRQPEPLPEEHAGTDEDMLSELTRAELIRSVREAIEDLGEDDREELRGWLDQLDENRGRAPNGTPRTSRHRARRMRAKQRLSELLRARGMAPE